MRQGSDPNVELDCFLEIEGGYTPFAEEIAGAVAEEIEAWVAGDAPMDRPEAEAALSVAKQLRVLGWLITGELGDDPAASRERFEVLMHQVGEILLPPSARDGGGEPRSRRHFSSAMILATQSLYDLESEDTVVKRAVWERNTNRALPGSDHPPPPSGRVAPSYPPLRGSGVVPSAPPAGGLGGASEPPASSRSGSSLPASLGPGSSQMGS